MQTIDDEEVIATFRDMAKELATQDNRITQDPIFMVQELFEWGSEDGECGAAHETETVWYNYEEGYPATDEQQVAFEKQYSDSFTTEIEVSEEENEDSYGTFTRAFLHRRWINLQPFFTQKAAEEFVRSAKHRYQDLRIYVESGWNNPEWKFIRAFIARFRGEDVDK